MNTYNGWANRETWLVNLHFEPETKQDIELIKEQLQEWYDDLNVVMKDFISLEAIDWDQLESHLDTEEEEE